jgi:hypothetical protein
MLIYYDTYYISIYMTLYISDPKKLGFRKIKLEFMDVRIYGKNNKINVFTIKYPYTDGLCFNNESLRYDIESYLNFEYDIELKNNEYNDFTIQFYKIKDMCQNYFNEDGILIINSLELKYNNNTYNCIRYNEKYFLATQVYIHMYKVSKCFQK